MPLLKPEKTEINVFLKQSGKHAESLPAVLFLHLGHKFQIVDYIFLVAVAARLVIFRSAHLFGKELKVRDVTLVVVSVLVTDVVAERLHAFGCRVPEVKRYLARVLV